MVKKGTREEDRGKTEKGDGLRRGGGGVGVSAKTNGKKKIGGGQKKGRNTHTKNRGCGGKEAKPGGA